MTFQIAKAPVSKTMVRAILAAILTQPERKWHDRSVSYVKKTPQKAEGAPAA